MIRIASGFLALLALLPALQARVKAESPTPQQQYQALLKEYDKAMSAYQKAKTPEAKGKVFQDKYPQPDKFAPRFLELAEKNPNDPASVEALAWIITNSNSGSAKSDPKDPRSKALRILLRDHIQSEKL